ncbi:MAG TPA: DNA primase, partial [Alicyclobacillus sp.]|nr:DNA primase [Alicyclobacillus sp.]
AWNERNRPPLPLKELYRTIDSIARRQAKREWGA